ncbi:cryptochrome/photolyase family protein, partial [Endobacter medicaginis]
MWTPGERGAAARLEAFLEDGLEGYDRARDMAGDENGTSHLSPHLRWGEISPRQVWHALGDRQGSDAQRFRAELLWRDFAANLLMQRPELPERALRAEFERLPWRRDAGALADWQRGRSGIPIVDAGMRQLWHTGWMHNRVRMIVASWLTKHLLIDWRGGAAWFLDTLVDGDLASNSANWQWVAGCGTEAQPFFRIFNPLTQARKFDADGAYVREWVPELAKLPDRWLHQPWAAPEAVLGAAGVRLGEDYPRPA